MLFSNSVIFCFVVVVLDSLRGLGLFALTKAFFVVVVLNVPNVAQVTVESGFCFPGEKCDKDVDAELEGLP